MKLITLEVPDEVAKELDALVQSGWFHSQDEIARMALLDFVRRHRFELQEQFQQEDIDWALQHRTT